MIDQEINKNVKHHQTTKPGRLSEIIQEIFQLTLLEFKKLLFLGSIYVNNERQSKDKIISEGSAIRLHTNPQRYDCNLDWSSRIVFENDFCLVLNKPSGVPSHPMIDNALENALTKTSLARRYPLFVTHRLDTLTSGLIVYGKKTSFVRSFNLQLQARTVEKKYVALVESQQIFPPKLTHYMDSLSKAPKKMALDANENWLKCELEILEQKILESNLSWVKIRLLTGRTHQIRAQFSFMQAPVSGDILYGARSTFNANAIALRSSEIEFDCGEKRIAVHLDEDFL